ncbi:MAG: CRISPR-associated helicase Cas3' [Oscillospiraceae bacterium]|jgi:CRISPR-associated endonuclease/helicase Cas3
MAYFARIRHSDGVAQGIEEHCRNCARYAAEVLPGLRNAAYLAGLLHDMGKFAAGFQDYITRAARGERVIRGSVNHTFAAVRFILDRWHTSSAPDLRNMASEIIAVSTGAHHGLFDCIDSDGRDRFLHRLTAEEIGYQEARSLFLMHCADLDELDRLFNAAEKEIMAMVEQMKPYLKSEKELRFCLALLSRMLLSTVIDADRRDTAEFMYGIRIQTPLPTRDQWESLLTNLEVKLAQMPSETLINTVRREISNRCREAGKREKGIYRLSVPTGGGKTLSGLRYALSVAAQKGKKRIFFAIPLLSVLEQNAKAIREAVNNDTLVLEHHSNIIRESKKSDELNELDENELLMETWDAPIVITTLVQLLNTLFLDKTSSIRRMHALADSVIVIDEVQSVPRKMLSLFNIAMNFLASACNSVIVLCSATQPCLEYVPHALHFREPADLVTIDPAWRQVFHRTEIQDKRKKGGYTTDELTDLAVDCMNQANSLLIICNTKAEARSIYNAVSQLPDVETHHLSTSMCMAHRVDTLAKINSALEKKRRMICVSTQLVEAGVDFSFACVIRVSAGLDNIVQAAGRCNRNGEFGRLCPVYIVNLREENLSHLKEIRQSQLAAESVMAEYALAPDRFQNDLASDASIEAYYRRLYIDLPKNALDYPLKSLGTDLFTLLSDNRTFEFHSDSKGRYVITQAFKTAGSEFRVFDDDTIDVLVPYGQGKVILSDLQSNEARYDLNYRRKLLAELKPFSISLYEYELKRLQDMGGIYGLFDGSVLVLRPEYYSYTTGLDVSGGRNEFLEG